MNPKTDITFYRTQGDTDPITFDLRVQDGGVITKVPSNSTVKLNLKLATLTSITGTSTADGVFSFSMASANTANVKQCKFEVSVSGDYDYVIGTGTILFNTKLS